MKSGNRDQNGNDQQLTQNQKQFLCSTKSEYRDQTPSTSSHYIMHSAYNQKQILQVLINYEYSTSKSCLSYFSFLMYVDTVCGFLFEKKGMAIIQPIIMFPTIHIHRLRHLVLQQELQLPSSDDLLDGKNPQCTVSVVTNKISNAF